MNDEDEEWETDNETEFEYFRLKLDNLLKLKHHYLKHIKFRTKKYKRIDKEGFESLNNFQNFMTENVFPNIKVNNLDKNIFSLNNEFYNVIDKPEIGSSLIFELGKNNLQFLGVSKTFKEGTTKIYSRRDLKKIESENFKEKTNNNNNLTKKRRKRTNKSKKEVKKENKLNNIEDLFFHLKPEIKANVSLTPNNKEKKRRRKRRSNTNHRKKKKNLNSTIIEIKKIDNSNKTLLIKENQ